MSITRLISCVLLAGLFWIVGCATPDPLAGWKPAFHEPDQAITNDYQDYIRKLPPEERKFAGMIQYYQDGTGQFAIKIEVPLNGVWREHVLIYGKDNKRVKVIKYSAGGYRS
ncbi:MAG TPA: hypothetical protein VMB80_14550 [Candidatus Acidoferrum sp.]|nr:hypothetical protein [Candidatus Acidoferrum sp.]